jgi:hypothetical protein
MTEAVVLSSLAGLEAITGRVDDARTAYRRARTIYEVLELPLFVAALAVISGPIELLAGDAVAAEDVLRPAIAFFADRAVGDAVAFRSALLAIALLEQGRRDDAVDALGVAEPVLLISRIVRGIAAGRVYDDVSIARETVKLASETDALNLHADARATLGDLLASRSSDEARMQRRIALELYERKENALAAQALRTAAAQV